VAGRIATTARIKRFHNIPQHPSQNTAPQMHFDQQQRAARTYLG